MLLSHKYPKFFDLLAGYFNADFSEEYGHYDKALEAFCRNEDLDGIQRTIHEINSYLFTLPKNTSMETIEKHLDAMGNAYYYERNGFNSVSFLQYLKDYLQNYLDRHQK